MSGSDNVPTIRRPSAWLVWLIWVGATSASILIMGLLAGMVGALASALLMDSANHWINMIGAVILIALVFIAVPGFFALSGAAQHPGIRRSFPGETDWFLYTLLGAMAGVALGSVLMVLAGFGWFLIQWGLQRANFERDAGLGAIVGLLVGVVVPVVLAQWLVLRRHSRRAVWWVLIGSITWVVAPLAAFVRLPDERSLPVVILSLLAVSVVIGGITGTALVYILRGQPADNRDSAAQVAAESAAAS